MKHEIYLILDNIRSRENVGSIFRTADAAGVKKIYLCGITPTPITKHEPRSMNQETDKIAKTALGAEKWVPWGYRRETWRIITELKNKGIRVIALERFDKLTASRLKIKQENIFNYIPEFPLALVLGNEVKGLSPKILKYCDKKIAIPMYGRKESLNVAVAFGIAVYIIRGKNMSKAS